MFDTEADMKQWLDSPGGGSLWGRGPHDEYVRDNLVGTAEQVGEKVQEFVDAGCREFVLWFRDSPSSESLEAFAARRHPSRSSLTVRLLTDASGAGRARAVRRVARRRAERVGAHPARRDRDADGDAARTGE